MDESEFSEQWEQNDDDCDKHPLLPPEDRLWVHPSEAKNTPELHNLSSSRFGLPRFIRHKSLTTSQLTLVLVGILMGALLGTGEIAVVKHPTVARINQNEFAVKLPQELSNKISKISKAVTQIKTSSGSMWQAAIFVTSAKYLVTSATQLQPNETLFAKNAGRWERISVTALDPLTDSAILQPSKGASNFIGSYLPDTPPVGALDEVVAPSHNSSVNRLLMAIVSNASIPLSLSEKIYLANSIELTTESSSVPLGSLVLDPEGDPIGIVVKAVAIPSGLRIWASPLPSITRVASMIAAHNDQLHGYLGVEGLTTALPNGMPYSSGVIVTKVTPGSPAVSAGIAVGMIIVAVGSNLTPSLPVLQSVLESKAPGSKIQLLVLISGQTQVLNATLESI